MRIIYMGTPDFAVPSLHALIHSRHQVVAVCTQPDRPAGRGHKLTPSPVKVKAMAHDLPVYQPETLRLEASRPLRATLRAYQADIFVVAAYGLMLPKGILNMPPMGCINVHASLLPQYRGASPIHAALLNGDQKSGVTIMHMDIGLDTGDMIHKRELDISPQERFLSLHHRMAHVGAEALLEALDLLEGDSPPRTPQDDALSCYAPILKKGDGMIDWNKNSHEIINLTRAFDPWPGGQSTYQGKPLKIWTVEAGTFEGAAAPGTILDVVPTKGVLVKTGDGALWIVEIQGEGSKRMATPDYLRGREIIVGQKINSLEDLHD